MKPIQFTLFFASAALVTLLSGCETMSPSQCKTVDWSRQGYNDGVRGEKERIADYAEDCNKVGIAPNAREYRRGWDAGIAHYCTAQNGWNEGLKGNSYKASACQGQAGYNTFARFLEAGMNVHRTREHLDKNDRETNRLQKRLQEVKTDEEKRRIREELRDIDREQYRLRERLREQQRYAP